MTALEEKLVQGLRDLVRAPVIIEPGIVTAVNAGALTCDVRLLNETDIPDVRLKAAIDGVTDGIAEIPKVNSSVLVCLVGNDMQNRFMIACSEVEEVVMYHGDNGGLVNISPLVDRLNAIEDKLNDLIGKFKGHTHVGVTTGAGTSGVPDPPSLVIEDIDETEREDLEDTKVKH